MHLEAVIEWRWRCTGRPCWIVIGEEHGGDQSGGGSSGAWCDSSCDWIHCLTCNLGNGESWVQYGLPRKDRLAGSGRHSIMGWRSTRCILYSVYAGLFVQVNLPFLMWQVLLPIWRVQWPIPYLLNQIRQVIPLTSHILSYPPSWFPSWSPISLSLPSSQKTKLSPPSLSLHSLILSKHWVQLTPYTAYTKYSIHRAQHAPSTAFTKYSIHPTLPFFFSIWWLLVEALNVASASCVPPYKINHHQPALHDSSKVKSLHHIPMVASYDPDV